MKLLVGGDSFAEFLIAFMTMETKDYQTFLLKKEKVLGKIPIKHWCQILDQDAVSVGITGADISVTSFVTIQELMTQKFTHCIFFVTDFYRDTIEINKKQPIDSTEFAQNTDFDSVYKNRKFIKNIRWSSWEDEEADKTSEKVYKKLRSSIWHETDEFIGKHKPGIMQYLRYHADFKYIHDRLSNLMFLKKYCDDNNIGICFVLPFWPRPNARGVIEYIPGEHFYYDFKMNTANFLNGQEHIV